MAQLDLDFFKSLILEQQQEVFDELNEGDLKESLKEEVIDKSYAFHMADVGSDNNEREKSFMVASIEGNMLRELNEALDRIENGTYGICAICDEPIHPSRLEAIPYAKLCLECKAKEENL